jgi:hypothetical protein
MEDMWDLRIGGEILTPGSMESISICMGKAFTFHLCLEERKVLLPPSPSKLHRPTCKA